MPGIRQPTPNEMGSMRPGSIERIRRAFGLGARPVRIGNIAEHWTLDKRQVARLLHQLGQEGLELDGFVSWLGEPRFQWSKDLPRVDGDLQSFVERLWDSERLRPGLVEDFRKPLLIDPNGVLYVRETVLLKHLESAEQVSDDAVCSAEHEIQQGIGEWPVVVGSFLAERRSRVIQGQARVQAANRLGYDAVRVWRQLGRSLEVAGGSSSE